MIMNTNTNNIIKVNIHVFNRFTNKNEIVKVSVKADSVMELCERLAGVDGRNLHQSFLMKQDVSFHALLRHLRIILLLKRKLVGVFHLINMNMME